MEAAFAAVDALLAFLVSVFLPKLTERVPSALAGIAVGTVFEWAIVRAAFKSHTTLVGDLGSAGGSLPTLAWFQESIEMPPLNLETLQAVYPLAIVMACIGLLESVMTLKLINEHTKTPGNIARECVGQGLANLICGACGGMGGCAMLGQSMINVSSGARGRLSTIFSSLALLLIILVASPAINILPVAALAGVMFNVVFHTFDWDSLSLMAVAAMPKSWRKRCLSEEASQRKIRRVDALVIFVVTMMTLLTNLAIGVAAGVAVSFCAFVQDSAELISVTTDASIDTEDGSSVKIYHVSGVLFFGSAEAFLELFDVENDPKHVRLVFETGYVSDFSAIEALNKLGERYGELGKRVTLQLSHPGSSKIVDKAANLLVREIRLTPESERPLDMAHHRHNIESYGRTQAFGGPSESSSPVMNATRTARSEDPGLRQRPHPVSLEASI
jgi:SulP family sulfate permease